MIGAVVLAGGRGKRMNSDLPKPLYELGNISLLEHTLLKLTDLPLKEIVVVVGYKGEEVINKTSGFDVRWAFQSEPLGNADALRIGINALVPEIDNVLAVQADDSTFYHTNTLWSLVEKHQGNKATISLLSVEKEGVVRPSTIMREGNTYLDRRKMENQNETPVFYSGCACFNVKWLRERAMTIPFATNGELMVTNLFDMAKQEGERVNIYPLANANEWQGINNETEYQAAKQLYEESGGYQRRK